MIQPNGYFKLWRMLLTKPIWLNSTPEQKVILITLLAMANYLPKQWEWKGEKYECQPGQFVTSLEKIQKDCGIGISKQNIRTALIRFKKLEFLTNESTKTGRLITIVNWGLYQSDDDTLTKKLTVTSQRPNKDLTPIKERKKDKEVKKKDIKYTYAEFVHLTSAEYNRLVNEFGEDFTKRCIEVLDGYKGANNKTYADDNRAIRNWVIRRVQEEQNTANPKSKIPRGFQDIMDYGGKHDN